MSRSLSPEALQRYLVLIYPGLVGAVTMVSCSILALTHLLFEFKGEYLSEGLGNS
jgi:ribosomal RNA-processing protein 12